MALDSTWTTFVPSRLSCFYGKSPNQTYNLLARLHVKTERGMWEQCGDRNSRTWRKVVNITTYKKRTTIKVASLLVLYKVKSAFEKVEEKLLSSWDFTLHLL